MRYAIILVAFVAMLTVVGTALKNYQGYVKIGLSDGSYQMPLWYFLIALLVTVIGLIVLFKALWAVIKIPATVKRFGKNRRTHKANNLLQKGMLAMGKGQWKKAENILVKGARLSHNTKNDLGLFLSTAARAANHLGAEDRRDKYLLEARQLSVEGVDTFSAALSEASLYLDQKEPDKALAALQPFHTKHYDNIRLCQIESEAHAQKNNFDEVWARLHHFKKHLPSKKAFQDKQMSVATDLFSSQKSSIESIERVWSELPNAAKNDESVLLNFISALIQHGKEEQAEEILAKMIRHEFSVPLIHAYTQLNTGSSKDRLRKIQKWIKERPDNAWLNYGAAKFSYQSNEFELAKEYAEKSLKESAMPETLALLGKIYEALDDDIKALNAYKGSAKLTYADTNDDAVMEGDVLSANKSNTLIE